MLVLMPVLVFIDTDMYFCLLLLQMLICHFLLIEFGSCAPPSPSLINNNNNNNRTVTTRRPFTRPSSTRPNYFYTTRRRRDPNNPNEWLFPPLTPTRSPGGSNSNSNGLAYRSILPIRSSSTGYQGLYRNGNIFNDGSNNGLNYNYNNKYNGNIHTIVTIINTF